MAPPENTRYQTTLLPDPPAAARSYTLISVDDHLLEPRHLFEGRVPAEHAEHAPRVIEEEDGNEIWVYEGRRYPQVGLNAVAGRPKEEWSMEPARFDEMRPSCYDSDARVSDYWDPLLGACEETETVLCLHNASSSWTAARSPGAPLELYTTLFPVNALVAAADWLWAGVPTRFPKLRIALSEGGIAWVPMLIDRFEYVLEHSATGLSTWRDPNRSPTDALRQNFWFCMIDIGSTMALRDHIGVDHIMLETDLAWT